MFTKTAQLWHNATPHPHWCGLTLLAIDGVFWRTPDTPENDAAFPRQTHAGNPALYPQVKMVCQMELTSHLLTAMAFGMMSNSENELAERHIEQTGDNTLTLIPVPMPRLLEKQVLPCVVRQTMMSGNILQTTEEKSFMTQKPGVLPELPN